MKLKVSHFPQIPCEPFEVEVSSVEEGVKIMKVLAEYDLFQFKERIKPDYSNAQVLSRFDEEEGEWLDWDIEEDDEYFDDPKEYLEAKNIRLEALGEKFRKVEPVWIYRDKDGATYSVPTEVVNQPDQLSKFLKQRKKLMRSMMKAYDTGNYIPIEKVIEDIQK